MILYILDDDISIDTFSNQNQAVYICYSNKRNIKRENVYYIYKYIDENHEHYVSQFSKSVYSTYTILPFFNTLLNLTKISNSLSSLWISRLERKDYLVDPLFFDPILRLLAIRDIIKRYSFIQLKISISSNRERYVLQRLFKRNIGKPYKKDEILINIVDTFTIIFSISKLIVKSILYGFKNILSVCALNNKKPTQRTTKSNSIVFISPFTHIGDSKNSSSLFQSDYWSTLPTKLDDEHKSATFLHFYVNSHTKYTIGSASQMINSFNEDVNTIQCHQYLSSYLNFRTVCIYYFKYILYLVRAITASFILFVYSLFVFDPIFTLIRDKKFHLYLMGMYILRLCLLNYSKNS